MATSTRKVTDEAEVETVGEGIGDEVGGWWGGWWEAGSAQRPRIHARRHHQQLRLCTQARKLRMRNSTPV